MDPRAIQLQCRLSEGFNGSLGKFSSGDCSSSGPFLWLLLKEMGVGKTAGPGLIRSFL
jgi:hypothetical protein